MSDAAPVLPKDFSFAARDVIFNMTLMEGFGDGIYSAIFWFTIYMLVFNKGRHSELRASKSTLVIIVPLYILAMIHFSIRWVVARRSFVVFGDTSDSTLNAFLTQPQWCNGLSVISFTLMSLIADFVTVWRCWVIWNRNWKVVLLPFLIILTAVAFSIMSAIAQIDPNSGLDTDKFNKFAQFSLVYFSLALASTVLCTILIIYRITTVARDTGFNLERPYRKVLEVIAESAALYSVALIVFLPFLKIDDFSDGYPQAVLIPITGIAPTLIFARVAMGVSRDYTTVADTKDTGMMFAANTTIHTDASKTIRNESTNELNSISSQKKEPSFHEVC